MFDINGNGVLYGSNSKYYGKKSHKYPKYFRKTKLKQKNKKL